MMFDSEWCKEYLPDSYRLAHGEFFKARMPEEPATDVTESVLIETEGYVAVIQYQLCS
jgi:hypothetical protein